MKKETRNMLQWLGVFPISQMVFYMAVLVELLFVEKINSLVLHLDKEFVYNVAQHKNIEHLKNILNMEITLAVIVALIPTFFITKYIAPAHKNKVAIITTMVTIIGFICLYYLM